MVKTSRLGALDTRNIDCPVFFGGFYLFLVFYPGQEQSVYDAHAKVSAPYISVLCGIPVFFFIARYLTSKNKLKFKQIAFGLPLIYIFIDLLMLIPYEVNWSQHIWMFLLSFGSKIASSFYGAKSELKKNMK